MPNTHTTTFTANTLPEIRQKLETQFNTAVVIEHAPWGYDWAAKRALAWGRIVREGYEAHHKFIVEVTEVQDTERKVQDDNAQVQPH